MTTRSGFYTDYVNMVTWQANPENQGLFAVASYRIYCKTKGADDTQYTLRGEVTGSTMEFNDHGFSGTADAQNYVYAVTSVDDEGNESMFSGSLGTGSNGTAQTAAQSVRSVRK
jgi:hypothetical protein